MHCRCCMHCRVLIRSLVAEMAASSKVYQNKREREEYTKGELILQDTKRSNSGRLVHDGDLIDFLAKIDNGDANNSSAEAAQSVIQPESQMRLNGVIKGFEDENGLKAQTDYKIKSTDEKASTDQMGLNQQGELAADGNFEATSVTSALGDFTCYDNVCGDLGFFAEHITHYETGFIMQNYLDTESALDIIYSDLSTHGYPETVDDSYGSLWGDDIWQLNEQPIIQNDSESPQQD